MKRLLLIAALSTIAYSQDLDKSFTSLCVEDSKIGFYWENGKWNKTGFTEDKYIVKKLNSKKCDAEEENAKREKDEYEKWMNSNETNFRSGCYSINKHGEKTTLFSKRTCIEMWNKVNDKFKISKVSCEDMKFNPTGDFTKSFLPTGIFDNPKNDYKEPMSISHGKCSVIQ